jgi:hypothetical protein
MLAGCPRMSEEVAGVFVIAHAIEVDESISSLDMLHVTQVGRRVAP